MHEPSIGASDDWYTPPEIFSALRLQFDLDPCSPGPGHWVPCTHFYNAQHDGLRSPWPSGALVFMNPPFGERHGHVPWLIKFLEHGNGVAIVRAYTSSDWFHEHVAPRAQSLCFPRGKTKFIPSPETKRAIEAQAKDGKFHNAPGHGIALIGMGNISNEALRNSGLGLFVKLR